MHGIEFASKLLVWYEIEISSNAFQEFPCEYTTIALTCNCTKIQIERSWETIIVVFVQMKQVNVKMEGDTVNVIFKVVQQANKSRFDTHRHQNVWIVDSMNDLRKFLLEHFHKELSSPVDENSFRIGYITGRNQRFTISNSSNLNDAYMTVKDICLCYNFLTPTGPTLVKTCHQKSRFLRATHQKVHSDKRLQQQRALKRWKQLHKRFSMGKMMHGKKGTGK